MNSVDMTAKECRAAFAAKKVVWVDKHPDDMSIIFFTDTSDKGHVITGKKGAVKRYKTNMDRDMAISIIKGL